MVKTLHSRNRNTASNSNNRRNSNNINTGNYRNSNQLVQPSNRDPSDRSSVAVPIQQLDCATTTTTTSTTTSTAQRHRNSNDSTMSSPSSPSSFSMTAKPVRDQPDVPIAALSPPTFHDDAQDEIIDQKLQEHASSCLPVAASAEQFATSNASAIAAMAAAIAARTSQASGTPPIPTANLAQQDEEPPTTDNTETNTVTPTATCSGNTKALARPTAQLEHHHANDDINFSSLCIAAASTIAKSSVAQDCLFPPAPACAPADNRGDDPTAGGTVTVPFSFACMLLPSQITPRVLTADPHAADVVDHERLLEEIEAETLAAERAKAAEYAERQRQEQLLRRQQELDLRTLYDIDGGHHELSAHLEELGQQTLEEVHYQSAKTYGAYQSLQSNVTTQWQKIKCPRPDQTGEPQDHHSATASMMADEASESLDCVACHTDCGDHHSLDDLLSPTTIVQSVMDEPCGRKQDAQHSHHDSAARTRHAGTSGRHRTRRERMAQTRSKQHEHRKPNGCVQAGYDCAQALPMASKSQTAPMRYETGDRSRPHGPYGHDQQGTNATHDEDRDEGAGLITHRSNLIKEKKKLKKAKSKRSKGKSRKSRNVASSTPGNDRGDSHEHASHAHGTKSSRKTNTNAETKDKAEAQGRETAAAGAAAAAAVSKTESKTKGGRGADRRKSKRRAKDARGSAVNSSDLDRKVNMTDAEGKRDQNEADTKVEMNETRQPTNRHKSKGQGIDRKRSNHEGSDINEADNAQCAAEANLGEVDVATEPAVAKTHSGKGRDDANVNVKLNINVEVKEGRELIDLTEEKDDGNSNNDDNDGDVDAGLKPSSSQSSSDDASTVAVKPDSKSVTRSESRHKSKPKSDSKSSSKSSAAPKAMTSTEASGHETLTAPQAQQQSQAQQNSEEPGQPKRWNDAERLAMSEFVTRSQLEPEDPNTESELMLTPSQAQPPTQAAQPPITTADHLTPQIMSPSRTEPRSASTSPPFPTSPTSATSTSMHAHNLFEVSEPARSDAAASNATASTRSTAGADRLAFLLSEQLRISREIGEQRNTIGTERNDAFGCDATDSTQTMEQRAPQPNPAGRGTRTNTSRREAFGGDCDSGDVDGHNGANSGMFGGDQHPQQGLQQHPPYDHSTAALHPAIHDAPPSSDHRLHDHGRQVNIHPQHRRHSQQQSTQQQQQQQQGDERAAPEVINWTDATTSKTNQTELPTDHQSTEDSQALRADRSSPIDASANGTGIADGEPNASTAAAPTVAKGTDLFARRRRVQEYRASLKLQDHHKNRRLAIQQPQQQQQQQQQQQHSLEYHQHPQLSSQDEREDRHTHPTSRQLQENDRVDAPIPIPHNDDYGSNYDYTGKYPHHNSSDDSYQAYQPYQAYHPVDPINIEERTQPASPPHTQVRHVWDSREDDAHQVVTSDIGHNHNGGESSDYNNAYDAKQQGNQQGNQQGRSHSHSQYNNQYDNQYDNQYRHHGGGDIQHVGHFSARDIHNSINDPAHFVTQLHNKSAAHHPNDWTGGRATRRSHTEFVEENSATNASEQAHLGSNAQRSGSEYVGRPKRETPTSFDRLGFPGHARQQRPDWHRQHQHQQQQQEYEPTSIHHHTSSYDHYQRHQPQQQHYHQQDQQQQYRQQQQQEQEYQQPSEHSRHHEREEYDEQPFAWIQDRPQPETSNTNLVAEGNHIDHLHVQTLSHNRQHLDSQHTNSYDYAPAPISKPISSNPDRTFNDDSAQNRFVINDSSDAPSVRSLESLEPLDPLVVVIGTSNHSRGYATNQNDIGSRSPDQHKQSAHQRYRGLQSKLPSISEGTGKGIVKDTGVSRAETALQLVAHNGHQRPQRDSRHQHRRQQQQQQHDEDRSLHLQNTHHRFRRQSQGHRILPITSNMPSSQGDPLPSASSPSNAKLGNARGQIDARNSTPSAATGNASNDPDSDSASASSNVRQEQIDNLRNRVDSVLHQLMQTSMAGGQASMMSMQQQQMYASNPNGIQLMSSVSQAESVDGSSHLLWSDSGGPSLSMPSQETMVIRNTHATGAAPQNHSQQQQQQQTASSLLSAGERPDKLNLRQASDASQQSNVSMASASNMPLSSNAQSNPNRAGPGTGAMDPPSDAIPRSQAFPNNDAVSASSSSTSSSLAPVGISSASSSSSTAVEMAKKKWIVDPYGDQGEFDGQILTSTKLPQGKGTMCYSDGRVYSGNWQHGHWHGQGSAMFSNGDVFQGEYHQDQRHGHGVYKWKDGRVYAGQFHMDQRQGEGKYTWPDGAKYEGEFHKGLRHGQGSYTFRDGSKYTGEWQKGKYHGFGECRWADGRLYQGEWHHGKAHGRGRETRHDGSVRHDGRWENDVPVRSSRSSKSSRKSGQSNAPDNTNDTDNVTQSANV